MATDRIRIGEIVSEYKDGEFVGNHVNILITGLNRSSNKDCTLLGRVIKAYEGIASGTENRFFDKDKITRIEITIANMEDTQNFVKFVDGLKD